MFFCVRRIYIFVYFSRVPNIIRIIKADLRHKYLRLLSFIYIFRIFGIL